MGDGLHEETPGSVMRQRKIEEPWARDFIVDSVGGGNRYDKARKLNAD